jgi:hypothetical protein
MELRSIRVVHFGLGAIGASIARLTTAQRGLQVVGGIDSDPAKVGRDLGEVLGLGQPLGVPVAGDAGALLRQTHPDIVIHATTSLFHEVYPQIAACVRRVQMCSRPARSWWIPTRKSRRQLKPYIA